MIKGDCCFSVHIESNRDPALHIDYKQALELTNDRFFLFFHFLWRACAPAGLSVKVPTDQQFWRRCFGLALTEEDEACEVSVGGGGWYLTSEKSFPGSGLCVTPLPRGPQHTPCLKRDSNVRVTAGIYTRRGVEKVLRFGPWSGGAHVPNRDSSSSTGMDQSKKLIFT